MATTADFKNGLFIDYNGKPCSVVWFQHVKPGKGPAFVKTKLRNLENGRILENTFTAGARIDFLESIQIIRVNSNHFCKCFVSIIQVFTQCKSL